MRSIVLLAAIGLAVAGCLPEPSPPTERSDTDGSLSDAGSSASSGTYRNLAPEVGYVGIAACAECHEEQAKTYVESQMGRSFKPATRDASAADWDNTYPVHDPYHDFYYLPFARGDSLFLMEYRLAGADTVFKRVEKIDYIVGSGHHTNSHMMEVNGYIYQVPITWYTQEKRWDLPPGFDEGHSWRFERAIEVECMTCHNAMPTYVEGSDNRFAELPHGIDCERCHGPGELHVEAVKAGRVVDIAKEVDWNIVNPAKLPIDLQFDVCQRCHLQGVAVPREGKSFTDFRPGMRLGDVINVYFPRHTDSLSAFIMASHPDRLRMSDCRIPSKDRPGESDPLACITCHDPHVPVEALGRDAYNAPCIECHARPADASAANDAATDLALTECTEDEAARRAELDDCSTCHMPVVESIDIPHVRITDHNIRVVKEDEAPSSNENREFVRLAALTTERPSNKMLGEGYLTYFEQFNNVGQFLDSASVHLERARSHEDAATLARSLVRLWYLQEDYAGMASYVDGGGPLPQDDPWTLYRIGEAYSKLGRHRDALTYYRLAVDSGPDHLWFRTKLASAQVALQNPREAIAVLDDVLRDNPTFHHAYNNRGFAYLMVGDFEAAETDFQTTLEYDPDAKQALANLASLYFNTGDVAEAKNLVDRLLVLEPQNEQYLQFRDAVEARL